MRKGFISSIVLLSIVATPLWCSAQSSPPTAQPLTVDEVIQLHKGGLAEGILITRIKQINRPLQLSTDDLLRLSQAKVPDHVIQALMDPSLSLNAPAPQTTTTTASTVLISPEGTPLIAPGAAGTSRPSGATTDDRTAAGDPNDPLSPHDSGIYLYANKKSTPEMILLEPAAYSGLKTNDFANKVVGGIFKAKQKAVLQGNKATIRAIDRHPVFYFYFEERAGGLGKAGFFAGATSPNQFVLVKLEDQKNTRETQIAEDWVFGKSAGTDQKAMVPFKSERLKPGLYKVSVEKDLKPGEYAFMVSLSGFGAQQAGAANPIQIFDFGVPVE
jgi:hypothetical protein